MMFKFVALAAVLALAVAAPAQLDASESALMFEGFMAKFEKTYTGAEKAKRAQIFSENLDIINAHNQEHAQGKTGYTMGVNQFTDMTNAEFKTLISRPFNRTTQRNVVLLDASAAPDSVDWRTKGAVTPVKNQGQCGSCWSFSTTGSTEGAVQIATGTLTSLSEQQLMDCSTAEGDMSCNGGLMDDAFEYIIKNGGLDTEADYPYKAKKELCNKEKAAKHVSTISSFQDVQSGSEEQLAAAVANGPVSVAIEADQMGFQHYSGGVFDGACGQQLDHGVLVVGYTADSWIVKNSWGATWGDAGYIQLKRGDDKCGIANQPSYPVVSSVEEAPANGHYEDPNAGGCGSDEKDIEVQGLGGSFCSPTCSASSPCPTDVPTGTTARPECVLSVGGGAPTNCALICNPSSEADGCPTNATCKKIANTGVCTYDS